MPIIRRKTVLIVYGAFALYFAAAYFLHYPIPGILLRLKQTIIALAFLWLSASVGRKAILVARERCSRLQLPEETSNDFVWSAVAGASLFSLALLGLGLAGYFNRLAFWALTLASGAIAWRDLSYWTNRLVDALQGYRRENSIVSDDGLAALTASLIAIAFLCAAAPPTYYDSLVYHLALPAKYLQEGKVGFVAYNHYSHFPQNMEMIFAWFLAIGDDVSAQFFVLSLGILTGFVLVRIGRLIVPEGNRGWGFLLFLAAPCTLLLSTETYVETPLALWTSLAVEAALRANKSDDSVRGRGWLLVCGLLGGFAAGIKYTGAITPVLIAGLVLFWPAKRTWETNAPAIRFWRGRFVDAVTIAIPSFLVFLPWLVKNYFLTGGNPFFPFLARWFPARNVYLYQDAASAYFQVLDEYKGTSSLLLELFQLPWRLMSNPLSFGGGYDVTGDLGWALPLLTLPLFVLYRVKNPSAKFLLAYIFAHGLLWASLRPVLRFLFPIFPLVCSMAGAGITGLLADLPRSGRWVVRTTVALFLISNGVLFYLVERVRDPFPAALGLQTREEYLRRKISGYSGLEFINNQLPAESRILFVGEARGYYCRRPYVAPMPHLPQPLREWADQSADGEQLRLKLLDLGFTHLFFHRREAERLKGYRVLDLTETGQRAWQALIERVPPLFDDGGAAVFSLQEVRRG